jgi:hypothetical protein
MKTAETKLTGANRGNREKLKFSVLSVSSCSIPGGGAFGKTTNP